MSTEPLKLNIGCGETKIEGFVNVDCTENVIVKPDLVHDIRHKPLPYEDGVIDEIWMIHALEHIEFFHWETIFREFARLLKPNGVLLLSYPEFERCAKGFIENTNNQRHFYRHTLYGRQLYPSDYHLVPMHSPEIKDMLETYKFYRVVFREEGPAQSCNTTLVARRNPNHITREEIITKELGLAQPKSV
jgi:predicted SAM-dependent methyltransferase